MHGMFSNIVRMQCFPVNACIYTCIIMLTHFDQSWILADWHGIEWHGTEWVLSTIIKCHTRKVISREQLWVLNFPIKHFCSPNLSKVSLNY